VGRLQTVFYGEAAPWGACKPFSTALSSFMLELSGTKVVFYFNYQTFFISLPRFLGTNYL
jgi:hypothetical protein